MTFYDLVDNIKAIASTYTGGRIGFYFGTLKELNAIADKVLPMVYVVTDPEFVTIKPNFKTNTKAVSCMFLVLDIEKLDTPAKDTRDLQERLEPIGNGIGYHISQNETIDLISFEGSLKLKQFDDTLSGLGFRMNVILPDTECEYPYSYEND